MKAGQLNKLALFGIMQRLFGAENVVCEYRFHPVRMWRFDYAVPEKRIAVEYHGHAGFVGGKVSGHSTIKGLTNDCEKGNRARAQGWTVLSFTALHFAHEKRVKHKLQDPETALMEVIAAMQTESESNQN